MDGGGLGGAVEGCWARKIDLRFDIGLQRRMDRECYNRGCHLGHNGSSEISDLLEAFGFFNQTVSG